MFLKVLVILALFENISTKNVKKIDFKRTKRALIFQGSGTAKTTLGIVLPVNLEDKVSWRALNCDYNLQGQYSLPTTPIYWWNRWQGRTLKTAKEQFDRDGTYVKDQSRIFIYTALETFMERQGWNGTECLLRAICENTEIPHHHGVFAEIMDSVLSPEINDTTNEIYHDAYLAGKSGADCIKLYFRCPKGHGIFDMITATVSD